MKEIKTINDVDGLYDSPPIKTDDGKYQCPVCKKEYVREKAAISHMAARDCYSLKEMFQGTVHETKAYSTYKELISLLNPKVTLTLKKFRDSPYFNGAVRFTLFLSVHTLTEQKGTYMTWLNEFKGCTQIGRLFSEGVKESNLREFRKFLIRFEQFIDSASYYKRYRVLMTQDGEFFIKAIETGKIGLQFVLEQKDFPFEKVMSKLNADQQFRFEETANYALVGGQE